MGCDDFTAQARTANNHPPTAECPGCAAPAPLAEAREAAALREISALLDQYDGPNMIPAKVVPEIRAVLAALSAPPAPTEDERVVAARVCQREGQRKVGQGLTIDAGHLFDAAHQLRMAAAPTEGDDRG